LGMLEMNGTPSSIPSAYIGTRAQSPLTPGRLAGRVWRRTIHACRRSSRELHEGVWGGEKVGYISNFDKYYAEKIKGARLLWTPAGGVWGEKVGYISNFDNTMLRKSRVQDYCELQGGVCVGKKWVTLITLTILCWENLGCETTVVHPIYTELKRTFKIIKACETAFRVERNAIKSWRH